MERTTAHRQMEKMTNEMTKSVCFWIYMIEDDPCDKFLLVLL